MVPEIIALSILGIQLLYLFLFLLAFSGKRRAGTSEKPPVSVVICAHDEEHNLRELVPMLLEQEYPDFEIIIVEDRCNDGTYDYLLDATKRHDQLKMVRVTNTPDHINGKKFGLTLGIKAAKHAWVVFTDADCRPFSKKWLAELSQGFTDNAQIVIGYSAYEKHPGLLNSFIRFETLLTAMQYFGWALLKQPYMGVGRNLAYRKNLFIDNKGFHPFLHVTGGDDDLFVNAHARGHNTFPALGRESLVFSKPKRTWKDFYYQKLRHLSVGKWYRFSDKLVLGIFSLTWILTWLYVLPFAPFDSYVFLVPALFLVRLLMLILVVHKASRKMGDAFEAWKTPLLDFIYAFYYLVAGLRAFFSKNVRWKKN